MQLRRAAGRLRFPARAQPLLERPGIYPAPRPIERDAAALCVDQLVVAQQSFQAQQRHAQCLLPGGSLFLGPQGVDQLRLGGFPRPEGHQRL
jgi:hypothetical protein